MSAAERALHLIGVGLARCLYRVTALGLDNLPDRRFPSSAQSHHLDRCDRVAIRLSPRPIRYIVDQGIYRKPIPASVPSAARVHSDRLRHSLPAVRAATERIGEGEIVCLFPEGQLERGRDAASPAARLRIDRASRQRGGRPGLAGPALGFDLLVSGREIFQKMAKDESDIRSQLPLENRSKRRLRTLPPCGSRCSNWANFVTAAGRRWIAILRKHACAA